MYGAGTAGAASVGILSAMTAVRIRPAEKWDVPDLTETAVQSWVHAYRTILPEDVVSEVPHRIRRTVSEDWHEMYVAEQAGQIVGYFDFDPGTSHIRHIYVDPNHHRRGIGRLMMAAALDILRDRGYGVASIDVVEGTKAPDFHLALGWRERARSVDPHGICVISMTKEL